MKKRFLTLALVAAISATSLLACSSKEESKPDKPQKEKSTEILPDSTKVVLNEVAHSIFYAPMYVAIEEGYFEDEGINLELVTGFGADKSMTAVLSGEADIGFMGSEASIYTYNEGANDYVVNFAQLTQRAGNFLVAREEMPDFSWTDLKGKTVLGGRKGGMPEMVFEYILKQKGIDIEKDLTINQNIDFGSTAAAFSEGQADFTVEFEPGATTLEKGGKGYVVASLGEDSGYVPYTAFSAKKSYIEKNKDVILRNRVRIEIRNVVIIVFINITTPDKEIHHWSQFDFLESFAFIHLKLHKQLLQRKTADTIFFLFQFLLFLG